MERPRPGTYLDGLPENFYHNKDHGYSSSDLKTILKYGPEKFKYFYDEPSKPPSDAMKIGSILHCGLLRPDEFSDEICLMPDFNLRTKKGKLDKEIFEFENVNKLVVTQKQYDLGMAMVDACNNNDEICELLDDSVRERSMYADVLGTPFRARPDSYKDNVLHELKSTADGSPEGFAKQIANLNYHVSLAHYAHVMEECAPEKLEYSNIEYKFIVVENTPPHATAVYTPSERMIYVGNELWKEAIERLHYCLENDEWPGFNFESQEIDLPNWAVPKDMEE